MIVTCPSCSTRFLVDPAALGAKGRTVLCRGCGHRWFLKPPEEAPRPAAAKAPPIPPGPPTGKARERRGAGAVVGWLGVALVLLVLAAAVVGRDEVVASFPQAAPVYQRLGLPVTLRLGLEFREVTSARLVEAGRTVLVVEGEIVNVASGTREVPEVRVALLDEERREIHHALVRPAAARLEAGGASPFQLRLVEPPEQARNFSVTFEVPH